MPLQDGWAHMVARTQRVTSQEVLETRNSSQPSLSNTGIFAGTIGVRRLLKLFAKYNMKTTFFIPGHSLESFPEECAMVRDAGHEMYATLYHRCLFQITQSTVVPTNSPAEDCMGTRTRTQKL